VLLLMGKYALQTEKLTYRRRAKLLLGNSSALYFNAPILLLEVITENSFFPICLCLELQVY